MDYKYLRGFVSKDDFPKLIRILTGIHDKTLKNKVSILELYGGPYSGKTTLEKVMTKLSENDYGRAQPHIIRDLFNRRIPANKHDPKQLLKSLVELREMEPGHYGYMDEFQINCNSSPTMYIPRLYQESEKLELKIGLVVGCVCSDELYEIPIKTTDTRLPMYLHLPNKHKSQPFNPVLIVEEAVKEFHHIREVIESNITNEAYWRFICKGSCYSNLPKDLKGYMLRFLVTHIQK